jgi:hypothetical protein
VRVFRGEAASLRYFTRQTKGMFLFIAVSEKLFIAGLRIRLSISPCASQKPGRFKQGVATLVSRR